MLHMQLGFVHVDRRADCPFLCVGRGVRQLADFVSERSAEAGGGIQEVRVLHVPWTRWIVDHHRYCAKKKKKKKSSNPPKDDDPYLLRTWSDYRGLVSRSNGVVERAFIGRLKLHKCS